jgi:hypothetical protein
MILRPERAKYYLNCAREIFRTMSYKSGVVEVRNGNLRYKIPSWTDLLVIKEVVIDGDYEKYGIFPSVKDKVIVDIGAAFGDWTIMTARKFPKARIYAYEPDRIYFAALAENCRLNKIDNVKLINKAVMSMEELRRWVGFKIDHLKCDCEGCEFEIFKNLNRSTAPQIRRIVMEFHENPQHKVHELERVLKNRFRVNILPQRGVPGLGILTAEIRSF